MSLILEALRKLEREKQAAARPGFVVLQAATWGERRSRGGLLFGIAFAAAVCAALGIGLYLGASRTARVRETGGPPASAPAATPSLASPLAASASEAQVTPAVPVADRFGPEASAAEKPAAVDAAPLASEATSSTPSLPLAPPLPTAPGPPLLLTAIGARDGRAVAVIDDRLVHEGDDYEGVRVLEIGADNVTVLFKGERRTLRFP